MRDLIRQDIERRAALVAELRKGERSGISKRQVPEILAAAAKRAPPGKVRRLRQAIAIGVEDHDRGDYVAINSRSALRNVTQQLGRPATKGAKAAR